jgi:hypothetical protein
MCGETDSYRRIELRILKRKTVQWIKKNEEGDK